MKYAVWKIIFFKTGIGLITIVSFFFRLFSQCRKPLLVFMTCRRISVVFEDTESLKVSVTPGSALPLSDSEWWETLSCGPHHFLDDLKRSEELHSLYEQLQLRSKLSGNIGSSCAWTWQSVLYNAPSHQVLNSAHDLCMTSNSALQPPPTYWKHGNFSSKSFHRKSL